VPTTSTVEIEVKIQAEVALEIGLEVDFVVISPRVWWLCSSATWIDYWLYPTRHGSILVLLQREPCRSFLDISVPGEVVLCSPEVSAIAALEDSLCELYDTLRTPVGFRNGVKDLDRGIYIGRLMRLGQEN
jgi:hypothetical protein